MKNTLKIHDLSVNDWVKYDGKPYQVGSYDGTTGEIILITHDPEEGLDFQVAYDYELRPLPLNARILEASGFAAVRINAAHCWANKNRRIAVALDFAGTWAVYHKIAGTPYCAVGITVRFVHELQHVCRLLGEDIDIRL